MEDTNPKDTTTGGHGHLFPGNNKVPLLVRFYDSTLKPAAKDPYGRTLGEILSWDDKNLERSHNYIQILFPLPEGSPFNWAAPVVTKDVMLAFHSNADLRSNLLKSFKRMLTFYGFEYSSTPYTAEEIDAVVGILTPDAKEHISTDKCSVKRAPYFKVASKYWAHRMDHNHLRMTRIIRCLRILGLEHEARAFFIGLMQVVLDTKAGIPSRTVRYWYYAMARPLHVAPSDEICDWLEEWEEEQEKEKKKKDAQGNDQEGKELEEAAENGTEKLEAKQEVENSTA